MNRNSAIAGVVIATALVLTGCTSSDTRLSDDTTPVASTSPSEAATPAPRTTNSPASTAVTDNTQAPSTTKTPKPTGSVQNDPRTGKPVPKKLLTFMKFLNDTNVYVVEAELTDEAEIIAVYKRAWDWAAAAGIGLYAALTREELDAGVDPTDPIQAEIINLVTLDGTNYCAVDIRYLGEKLKPSNLIRQSLLTMGCAKFLTEYTG